MRFGEGLKRDANVEIDSASVASGSSLTRDLPFLANVRGMTSVAAHRGFRKLRRGHLFGGECSNRSYGEASGPCLGYDVAIGVGSFAFDTQDAAK